MTFRRARFSIRVFWDVDDGWSVTGHDCETQDGPFDEWELVTIYAGGTDLGPPLADQLVHQAAQVSESLRRQIEEQGIEQSMF
jgi:hypothetical protein